MVVFPLHTKCKKIGALFIADEIQTAIGRTGTNFAFEQSRPKTKENIYGEDVPLEENWEDILDYLDEDWEEEDEDLIEEPIKEPIEEPIVEPIEEPIVEPIVELLPEPNPIISWDSRKLTHKTQSRNDDLTITY